MNNKQLNIYNLLCDTKSTHTCKYNTDANKIQIQIEIEIQDDSFTESKVRLEQFIHSISCYGTKGDVPLHHGSKLFTS